MPANPETVQLLLVEDNPGDATLIRQYLNQSSFSDMAVSAEITHVETLAAAREHYADSEYDVVFLDLGLPESRGLETVERFLADDPEVPIVVLTGLDDRETAVRAIEIGAQDYLVKGKIDGYTISRSLRYAIERYERTRELQRQKRELERTLTLNRAMQDIAVQSRTRNEIELEFCRRLVEEPGRRFAWVGEPGDTGALEPRVLAGDDDGYLDAVAFDPDQPTPPPSAVAATQLEQQFVPDVTAEPASPWRDRLDEQGIASVVALPLSHDGVTYGVLAVYTTDSLDDGERELLAEIAEMLGSSIERAELRTALAADRVAEVELQLSGDGHYLVPIVRTLSEASAEPAIEVLATVPHDDTDVLQFLSLQTGGRDDVDSLLADVSRIRAVERLGPAGESERAEIRVRVEGDVPESFLSDHGGVVQSTVVTPTTATIAAEFSETADVRSVVDAMEAAFGPVTVQRYQKRETDRDHTTVLDRCDLTDKQVAALRTAYRYGYFEDTRQHYAEEIADALDVSRPTFQHHLRIAQRKLLDEVVDGDG